MTDILAIALEYIAMGWAPIPIPHKSKRPTINAWQNLRITEHDAAQWFNGQPQNIGVQLGERSGGLADSDLDTAEAISAAGYFLPPTLCFGRASKPRSHWLYQCDLWQTEDKAAIQFKFCTGKGKYRTEQTILELRIGGGRMAAQTVFPGSVHETGELIAWDDARETVAQVKGASLKQCCARAASAALLAEHFPSKGARHDAGLTLGGFLSRCGFNRPDAELFAEAVTIASGQPMEKVKDVRKAAREAWDEGNRAGGKARGFPALAETFGDDVAKHVAKWLGYHGALSNGHDEGRQDKGDGEPPEIITRRASDITPEPISWVWKYWLARGKFQIIGGVPETGKTTIAMSYAAIVTSGSTWPDGTRAAVGNVLVWTSEDSPADTLVPRLTRMGADLSRIHFIEQARLPGGKPRPFNPATDMPALVEKAMSIGDVVLLILDPVVAVMPMGRDSHNNAEARNGMQPVVDFAKASNAAVIGIGHLTKGTAGKDPLERLNGSVAFGALARLVMGAAKNEAEGDDEPERIMVRIKSNIGPSGGGFGYHIDAAYLFEHPDIEATRVVWEHELDGTAKELLKSAEGEQSGNAPKCDQATRFLTDFLASSKRTAAEIEAAAQTVGIAWRTVRRASDKMNIRKFREGGKSWWQLT